MQNSNNQIILFGFRKQFSGLPIVIYALYYQQLFFGKTIFGFSSFSLRSQLSVFDLMYD